MIKWALDNAFVWLVRVVVLLAACFSMKHILADQLGYRVELTQLVIAGLLTIVTVRVWMPWSRGGKRSYDDVSGV
jgi:hypothetical protein